MQQVTLEEAATKLPELFEAALRGEEVLVTANGEINATIQLVPRAPSRRPQFGSAKGKIWMADDFDAPLEEFKEYME
jgi:antitoxin (DNA-binding transcriptional repressor) of toxin-antitoxin stability system